MVVLITIIAQFVHEGRKPSVQTSLWPVTANVTFLDQYNHMSSFIFAYQVRACEPPPRRGAEERGYFIYSPF